MASVHKFPARECWRVSYRIKVDGESRKKAKYAKTKSDGNLLRSQAERLEAATRSGLVKDMEIEEWIDRRWLTPEEAEAIFSGFSETAARKKKVAAQFVTDYDKILEAYEQYSADNSKGGIYRKTHRTNMSYANQVLAWLQADCVDLKSLDEEAIQDRLRAMRRNEYAEWTVFHYFQKLRLLLDQAVTLKMIPHNPARRIKLRGPRVASARRMLDEEEITTFLDVSLQHRHWISGGIPTVVRLGLYAGLRNEEMIWLKWDCIDFRRRIITIRETTCDLTGETWKPKDYEMRRLDIKEPCVAYLKAEQERQRKIDLLGPFVLPGGGRRRRNLDGKPYSAKPLSSDAPQKAFGKMISAENLDRTITIYSLRHTYATMSLRSGIDLRTVQRNMGHSKLETTMEYLHYIEPEKHPTDRLRDAGSFGHLGDAAGPDHKKLLTVCIIGRSIEDIYTHQPEGIEKHIRYGPQRFGFTSVRT